MFGHGQGGKREMVHPGNQDYVRGDRIERPKGGGGRRRGGGQASDSGEGEDDFVFHLSKEEFMQVFFDDLALPNLARTTLAETPEYKTHRAGFSSDGTPNNLHVVRSMRGAIGRRIALGSDARGASCASSRSSSTASAATRTRTRSRTRSPSSNARSRRCARASTAFPTSTRSTCATAAACACRCRPARR